MKTYKLISLVLLLLFACTGTLFFFFPEKVLDLFNTMSWWFGMVQSPLVSFDFFQILAVAYMYLVSVLAFFMIRNPESRTYPFLLINAKIASSGLSLAFFVLHEHLLIYLANCVIDALIAGVVLILYVNMRKLAWVSH
jgi:hypothetical protein